MDARMGRGGANRQSKFRLNEGGAGREQGLILLRLPPWIHFHEERRERERETVARQRRRVGESDYLLFIIYYFVRLKVLKIEARYG